MTARRIKSESIENLKRVVEVKDDNVETVGDMGVVMADAYAESIKNEEHVEEVKDELEKKADDIKTENPDTGKEVKNEFTAKLVLDESLDDFTLEDESEAERSARVTDADMFDTYLDMDMFDFIYELVCMSDDNRKPLPPLGYPHKRFQISYRDVYRDEKPKNYKLMSDAQKKEAVLDSMERQISAPQVGSGGDFIDIYGLYVTSYKDPETGETVKVEDPDWRFREMQQICDKYKFEYRGPEDTYKRKRNSWSFAGEREFLSWDRVMRIYVPTDENGYPMGIEEYFETIGLTLEDVMPESFCNKYRKCQARVQREAEELLKKRERERAKAARAKAADEAAALKAKNDEAVDKIVNDNITYAARNGDIDLKVVKRKMYNELIAAELKYKKKDVDAKFDAAFEDDYDEE